MSVKSKFYQVTEQLLVEYKTDQYAILSSSSSKDSNLNFYMVHEQDGNQYYLPIQDSYDYAKFPNDKDSTYHYPGKGSTMEVNNKHEIVFNDEVVGTIIPDTGSNPYAPRRSNCYLDTVNIYILTGYVLNSLSGLSVKVKAKVTAVKNDEEPPVYVRINDYLTLLDWYMPKELLKDSVEYLPSPLYLNSRFYDRKIEIKFPSPLDAAIDVTERDDTHIDYVLERNEDTYRGNINRDDNILIEISTVRPENTEYDQDSSDYASDILLDAARVFAIKNDSNSNYLNAKIYEDQESYQILYYPTYGDSVQAEPLNKNIMGSIETGAIPMVDLADLDYVNEGMNDFLEEYGDRADKIYKWIVINELVVTYVYCSNSDPESKFNYSEYLTNTIDYSDRENDNTDFWISRFAPYPKEVNGYTCQSINIDYTAHLFNRLNNIDIIRKASMSIQGNPVAKYKHDMINVSGIINYKIVNKIEKPTTQLVKNDQPTKEKIVRSYYDVTNILIKDSDTGNMYTNGKMVLYLKHSGSQYMLKLYTINDDNIRVPLNLTGNTNYKLVFPSVNSNLIEIQSNKDSANYNLSIGQLIFYISRDKAKAIMDVPISERYFAITTDIPGNKGEETCLYEGSVEWR